MYVLEKVLVRDYRTSRFITTVNETVKELVVKWDEVSLILSNYSLIEQYILKISDYPELVNYNGTVLQFVQNLPLSTYTPTVYDPKIAKAYVETHDVWDSGWNAVAANALANISTLDDPTVQKDDILLRQSGIDYPTIGSNALVSVNGLIHPVTADANGVYVLGAIKNTIANDRSDMTWLNFSKVGGVTYLPIDETTVRKPIDESSLYGNGAYISIPTGFENHTLMVCICGHLHLLSDILSYFDTLVVRIQLDDLGLEDIIMEHHGALGLSELVDPITGAIHPGKFRKDETIRKILYQLNTFIVAVATPSLFKEVRQLAYDGLPGSYTSSTPLHGIVHYSNYLTGDYLQFLEDGIYSIKVKHRYRNNYRHRSTDWERQMVADGSRESIAGTQPPFLYLTDLYIET